MSTPGSSYFDNHPAMFRGLVTGAGLILLFLASQKFYWFASSPTDENVFTNSPTELYFKKQIAARPLNKNSINEIISAGDMVVGLNGEKILSLDEIPKRLQNVSLEDSIVVSIWRLHSQGVSRFRTTRAEFERGIANLPMGAYVIGVIENGASDRAGMLEGDLIVKINGKSFKSIWEADYIMRSAQADRAIEYQVMRSGELRTLHVRLARFGVSFQQVAFFLCGLAFLFTGLFLGVRQPGERAIRILSVGFVLLGYGFSAIIGRPGITPGFWDKFYWISPMLSMLLGVAVWTHSSAYFPKMRYEIVSRKWVLASPYIVAAIAFVFILFWGNDFSLLVSILALVICNIIIYTRFRNTQDAETKQINKLIKRISITAFIVSIGVNILLNVFGYSNSFGFVVPAIVAAIPVGYLYVIGRYRLFDIDIRLKRNIQYTFLSLIWPALLVFLAVRSIIGIVHADLEIPNIRLTGASFEILDTPLTSIEQGIAEKVITSGTAILIALGFIVVGKKGQKFINNRYYRNEYDYKEAAQQISEITASKVELSILARGVIEKMAAIMHLKQAGILIFRDEEYFVCGEAFGIPPETWTEVCSKIDPKTVKSITKFKIDSRFSVENLPEYAREALIALKFRHIAALQAKGKLTGLLLLGEKLSDTPFHAEDFSFLTAVSNQISIAIENAFLYENLAGQERLKHELEIARRIQLESLPQKTPNIAGLDISGISKPAMEVGGDYFDYLVNSPECITIVIGDVSGKGTSAALYMSKVQGMIRSLHEFAISTPQQLLNHANKLLHLDIDRRSYITALGARFDSSEKCVTVSRAGHLPLYHFSTETNCFKTILPKGIGLALSSNKLFSKALEEVHCPFKSGDIFLMLTDGITEAQNLLKEEFGAERVEKIITENALLKAEEIRDKVIGEMEAFAGEAEQHDDCTVIVVKVV